jgi:hypothetical protein
MVKRVRFHACSFDNLGKIIPRAVRKPLKDQTHEVSPEDLKEMAKSESYLDAFKKAQAKKSQVGTKLLTEC